MFENHRLVTFIEHLQRDTDLSQCLSDFSGHQNPLLCKTRTPESVPEWAFQVSGSGMG